VGIARLAAVAAALACPSVVTAALTPVWPVGLGLAGFLALGAWLVPFPRLISSRLLGAISCSCCLLALRLFGCAGPLRAFAFYCQ
jgi:hypothetical protein